MPSLTPFSIGTSIASTIFYPIIAASLYYVFAWAALTEAIWSRYPKKFGHFMLCPACSGSWWTALVAAAFGFGFNWSFCLLPGRSLLGIVGVFLAGLWGTYWVPRLAAKQLESLTYISGLIPEETTEQEVTSHE